MRANRMKIVFQDTQPRLRSHRPRLQLVPEPLHNGHHPALVHPESQSEGIRVVEARGPRRHDAAIRLVRAEADEGECIRARDGGECLELLAHSRGEAGEAHDARVLREAVCGDVCGPHEVRSGHLGGSYPDREVKLRGVEAGADGACRRQALEGLADDAWRKWDV